MGSDTQTERQGASDRRVQSMSFGEEIKQRRDRGQVYREEKDRQKVKDAAQTESRDRADTHPHTHSSCTGYQIPIDTTQ